MELALTSPPTATGPTSSSAEELVWYGLQALPDYFQQSSPFTNESEFSFRANNFGLVSQPYPSDSSYPSHEARPTDWQRFYHHLARLNTEADSSISYRLMFLGRHGQGYHNIAESFYSDWECYWSALEGNGIVTWLDARLTPVGKRQARTTSKFWISQIHNQKMKTPQTYYLSPLDRAIETADIMYRRLNIPEGCMRYEPLIKEMLRETHGIHTCNKRSTSSTLRARWRNPPYRFEKDFTEDDELWDANMHETETVQTLRMLRVLDDILLHDGSSVISLTIHAGAIAAILRGIGHRDFPIETGGIIPVFIKTTKMNGSRPEVETGVLQPKPKLPPDFRLTDTNISAEAFRCFLEVEGGVRRTNSNDEAGSHISVTAAAAAMCSHNQHGEICRRAPGDAQRP